jgi:hydro-lyases, Fe-S type, tartrate/fumarate subfamily, alpha region
MRQIKANIITKTISQLCAQANFELRKDVLAALKTAYRKEPNSKSKRMLKAIIDNAFIAKKEKLAICQDTGLPVVFAEIGQDVKIMGDLKSAINKGIELGYKRASLRNSIVADPLLRGKPKYSPVIIHIDLVKGGKIKLTVLPKGFGCENKSQLKMFNPTATIEDIKKFIIDVVKTAGPDACPPYVAGVGIGGAADLSMVLAKKALLRSVNKNNAQKRISLLEKELLSKS